ncbi:MAG: TonB C-terminal domain-containing protein [Thiobacillaceae bacterium]
MSAAAQHRPEIAAGVLAIAVHVFFLVLLVFGVSWQIENPAPVMVDLWSALPVEPAPVPKPEAVPKPEPVPPKVVEPPTVRAPDISLEKKKKAAEVLKKEEALRKEEDARQLELETEREEARLEGVQRQLEIEKKIAEKKRLQQLKREEDDMQKRMLAEDMAADTRQITAMETKAAADRRSAELGRIVADFREKIRAKIRGNTRIPDNVTGNPQASFEVNVLPTGEIVGAKLIKSSGNVAYDQAVERAIYESSPLPTPTDKDALALFRKLELKFQPKEN